MIKGSLLEGPTPKELSKDWGKGSLLEGFTPKELSKDWGKSEKTLARWRYEGTGPRFVRRGKTVFYPTQYLEEYYAERTAASTCEEAARLDRRRKTNGR